MYEFVKLTFTGWDATTPDWFRSWGCAVLPQRVVVVGGKGNPVLDTWIARRAHTSEEITVDVIPSEWVHRGLKIGRTGPKDVVFVVNA